MGERSDELSRYDLSDDLPLDQGAEATEATEDTAEIRAGIEQTRSDMSETIEAIQERLAPQHIKEQVKEQVREQFEEAKSTVRDATIGKAEEMVRNAGDTINEARYGLMETIRQNPLPAALVGIGLSWLYMNRRSGAPSSYARYGAQDRYYRGQPGYTGGANYYAAGARGYAEQGQYGASGALHRAQETAGDVVDRAQETVGNIADRTQQTVGNVVSQAQETAGNIASQAQETVGYIADQAQHQAQRVEDRFQRILYENPLAVGAAALAVGTAIGFSLPQTQRENELMGETRDNLIDRAQEVAQDTIEKVQQVAGEVVDQAQTTVRENAKELGGNAQ